jgi:hypothetical protein
MSIPSFCQKGEVLKVPFKNLKVLIPRILPCSSPVTFHLAKMELESGWATTSYTRILCRTNSRGVHRSKKIWVMSVCLLYVREFSRFWHQRKTGDPRPAPEIHSKSVSQSIPSLDQSSPCKGDFLTIVIKLYIDNGITHVQLNLFGERFSRTLQTFAQDAKSPLSHLHKQVQTITNRP